MSGYDRRQWRADLLNSINQIARNFKQEIIRRSPQSQQTPLPSYIRRITDDWIMEAKEALGLWEGESLSIGVQTQGEFESVKKALEGKAKAIRETLWANPYSALSWMDYPAAILGQIMSKSLAGIPQSNWQPGIEDEFRRLGSMGTERRRKIEAEGRAREEEMRRRKEEREEHSRRRAKNRYEAFRQRHPLPPQLAKSSTEARSPEEELRLKGLLAKQVSRIVDLCSREGIDRKTVNDWQNEVYQIFGISERVPLNECIRNQEVLITVETLLFKPLESDISKYGLAAFDTKLNKPATWLQYVQRFKRPDSSSSKRRLHSPGSRGGNNRHPKVMKTSFVRR